MSLDMIKDFMPIITKYANVEITDASIKVEKFEDGVSMEISTMSNEVGDMLTDMLVMVSKMAKAQGQEIPIDIKNYRDQ